MASENKALNFKITYPPDLARFRMILENQGKE